MAAYYLEDMNARKVCAKHIDIPLLKHRNQRLKTPILCTPRPIFIVKLSSL